MKMNFNESINGNDSIRPLSNVFLPSVTELLLTNIYCTLVAILSIIANFIIIFIIFRNQKLENACFKIISIQSMFNILMSIGFLTRGVLGLSGQEGKTTRLICFLVYLPTLTSATASAAVAPCAIGFDRLLAITRTHQYKTVGRVHLKLISLVCTLLYISQIILASCVVTRPVSALITCSSSFAAFPGWFGLYHMSMAMVFFAVSVLAYATMEITVGYRRRRMLDKKLRTATSGTLLAEERTLSKQMALLPVVRGMMIAYIIFGVMAHLVVTMAPFVDGGRHQVRMVAYAAVFKSSLALVDFVVLTKTCSEFRRSLMRLINNDKTEQTAVMSINVNNVTSRS